MKRIFAVLLMLVLAGNVLAAGPTAFIARLNGTDTVVLTQAPCTSVKVMAVLQKAGVSPAVIHQLRAAEATINGRVLEACYLANQNVQIVDELGDSGSLPFAMFAPVTES